MKSTTSYSTYIKERLLRLDIAFVIDTTASMGGEIEEGKRRLAEITRAVAGHRLKPQARFAVIGFRDHPPEDSTYAAQTFCDLNGNLASVQYALNSLTAAGGGDEPEAVCDGLKKALGLGWERMAQKTVLLVGDAPPHGGGGEGDGFPRGCPCGLSMRKIADEMNALGITGHAIGVRFDTAMTRSFMGFAKNTGGSFVHLTKSNELLPLLVGCIDEEVGKIAADLRTIEKIERGGEMTAADRESLDRLHKKGVRPIIDPIRLDPSPRSAPRRLRIRILK